MVLDVAAKTCRKWKSLCCEVGKRFGVQFVQRPWWDLRPRARFPGRFFMCCGFIEFCFFVAGEERGLKRRKRGGGEPAAFFPSSTGPFF